jgi:hypothetical protein
VDELAAESGLHQPEKVVDDWKIFAKHFLKKKRKEKSSGGRGRGRKREELTCKEKQQLKVKTRPTEPLQEDLLSQGCPSTLTVTWQERVDTGGREH